MGTGRKNVGVTTTNSGSDSFSTLNNWELESYSEALVQQQTNSAAILSQQWGVGKLHNNERERLEYFSCLNVCSVGGNRKTRTNIQQQLVFENSAAIFSQNG